jgi:hypothetical protein
MAAFDAAAVGRAASSLSLMQRNMPALARR